MLPPLSRSAWNGRCANGFTLDNSQKSAHPVRHNLATVLELERYEVYKVSRLLTKLTKPRFRRLEGSWIDPLTGVSECG